MRKLPDWIGQTDDSKIPSRVKLRVFLRFNGVCQCGCSRRIATGEQWDCDHRIALSCGGTHAESNLQPMLTRHHRTKTQSDVRVKSIIYRKSARHFGVKRVKQSFKGWRKFSGEPVWTKR